MRLTTHHGNARLLSALALLSAPWAFAQPNLTPYQPSGWSDKIVVTRTSGSTTDSSALTTADTLYVDWSVINDGNATADAFVVSLDVDGASSASWNIGSLGVNFYTYATDYAIGSLSAGAHTISVIADSGNTVNESNENDNTYTKNISVADAYSPAPNLISPANGAPNVSTTPTFSWSSAAGDTVYRIFVAAAAADLPTDPAATNGGLSVVDSATTSGTTFTPATPLLPGTTFYWEVQGQSASQLSHWSAVGTFTTAFPTGSGLTIVPTFDSSITSDPQAATVEATIKSAIAAYRAAFSDPITVSITFEEVTTGLGQSQFSYATLSYANYLAALRSHAASADDATALASLPAGPGNPVNGNTSINVKYPLARALGFNDNPSPGHPDGTIFLNISIMNLSGAATDPDKYSLYATACHEIDEVLALGSALDLVSGGGETLTGPIYPEDLFRYAANGAPSYTTSGSAVSYFSLDGSDFLAQFNQVSSGDYGDWFSYDVSVTPQVQDAFAPPGMNPLLAVELRALDVVGYTRVVSTTVANPPVLALTISGATLLLSWPTTASGYVLQGASSLTPPVSWKSASPAPGVTNGQYVVAVTPSNRAEFFRLKQ